ncbi:hypothetical protein HZU72_08430 [Halomonas sp. QX-2]|jgi:hypothetical protein|uniref:Uncharacterized protein n=2 Tax=Vreelandella sedimenti TaxID=2729618 RepID=A0A7Z0N6B4_9GAMM|nr:hypothetical protein [Halomonas sedimenti]|tara:strand:- start:11245 stop:11682 length:438 start_codon:yes stop_codon:yes gene_type:complete
MEVGIMDKQHDHIESKQISNRPRWLTLCMMATAASVIVLAGCGDNEETAPPAEEPSPLEQDATTQPEPGMSEEPAMEQDPGLSEEPAGENSMTQSEEPMSEESMPDDTMDEPAEGTMNPDEEPGFGEGTEPMPGAEEEDENSTSN